MRDVRLKRVGDANRRSQLQRCELEMLCAHRSASHGHHNADANDAQQSALARHVGAAHHQHSCFWVQMDTVADALVCGNQGMSELLAVEERRGRVDELWKDIGGVLAGVGCDRQERFNLTDRFDPYSDG